MTSERWQSILVLLLAILQEAYGACGADGVCGWDDAIGWLLFLLVIALLSGLAVLAWRAAGWYARRRNGQSNGNGNGDMLSALMAQIAALDDRIERLLAEVEELKRQRTELKQQAQEYAQLRRELEEKNVIDAAPSQPSQLCVLAVWTSGPGLDPQANANVLAQSGVEYTDLSGERATTEGILYELPRRKYNTIEVGLRGNADGLELADGVTSTAWWAELASLFDIQLFLLLADNSGGQSQVSIADAILRAKSVKAVISVVGPIEDAVARRFARLLYTRLGEGMSLQAAVRQARLAAGSQHGRLFRLQEKTPAP
jgi:cell division septum initiation protein DivIVA